MITESTITSRSWSETSGKEVYICGIGARTPLGFDAVATAAAAHCGISALGEHPCFVDKVVEPVNLAADVEFESSLNIGTRMAQMAVSAIGEALGKTFSERGDQRLQIWVGLPEARPGLPLDIGQSISAAILNQFRTEAKDIHILQYGHASGLMAMQMASLAISSGEADLCIATGIDSYHDATTLQWLDDNGWLMSDENRNGFPPGEAASACLLVSRSVVKRYQLRVLANIIAAMTTMEPNPIRGQSVCIGKGLTAALNGVIAVLDDSRQVISTTYCDLNGERYRNNELVYALLRTQTGFVDAHDYQCPADCWGDVGAASGLLFAILAIESSQRGYATGFLPLLWAGSECGYRTAILLSLHKPKTEFQNG